MGFNEEIILELLNKENFQLSFVITQKNRLSNTMLKLLEVLKIPCYIAENKYDLLQYESLYKNVDYILSYCFGIIIPDCIISKYRCFNIHPGNIKTNRGAYPLVRSILNDDIETVATLYRIGKKIDTGIVLGTYKVSIEKNDNNVTLMNKLNQGLGYLLEKLDEYNEEKEYQTVENGKYYKRVKDEEILIKENDEYAEMNKKIRAQKSYGGALANYKGLLVRISEIVQEESRVNEDNNGI